MFELFEKLESNVRCYCREFPALFTTAKDATLLDTGGRAYLDLFCGAGALNYGHNPAALQQDLLDYLGSNGITHSLDLYTTAKGEFIEVFERFILRPRGLRYRIMFPGPTGTNAVEAAIKLARKVTGRHNIAAFTNGFHGMTLGSLAATGSRPKRKGAGVPLAGVDRFPYDGYHGPAVDTLELIDRMLNDRSSGIDPPAAFLVETVQGEGGVNTASAKWLSGLARLAQKYESLLIIDDVQAGCGRTGTFFSFESSGVVPGLVCLSKSLSGYGLPLSMVLIRPDLDIWSPGEHNGTFRGCNLSFVTARSAILNYWSSGQLTALLHQNSRILDRWLLETAASLGFDRSAVRGRGMIRGLALAEGALAAGASQKAFEKGVLIETSGSRAEVLKFLPPLCIEPALLEQALATLGQVLLEVLPQAHSMRTAAG
jgi:diaminobutyrate-2-oxoglutarate transaminase